jgi:hypothetical protein
MESVGGAFRLPSVNCPRVSLTRRGENVAMLVYCDCVIGVVETGRSTFGIQATSPTRMPAVHIIKTVSNAELILSLKWWSILARNVVV